MSYQLVVLMAGKSNRFQEAGYEYPKALLYANTKMILNRIIDAFPNASEIVIVAAKNQKKYIETRFSAVSRIEIVKFIYIDQHDLGPSESVNRARDSLSEDLPIVVTYCDLTTDLDDSRFVGDLADSEAGVIVFTGFHPHTIRKPKFGYVKANSQNKVIEIREKNSYSDNPLNENASAGIYSFVSKNVLLKGIDTQISKKSQVNGEYYISLAINELVQSGHHASIRFIDFFVCWGTPEDFEDYNLYARIQELCAKPNIGGRVKGDTKLFLAGGQGTRSTPKLNNYKALLPLNNAGSHQLWSRSAGGIVPDEEIYFVGPTDVLNSIKLDDSSNVLLNEVPLNYVTDSGCKTALIGLNSIVNVDKPVSIVASDNLIGFDENIELSDIDFDLLVWLSVRYPIAELNSSQYSWVSVSDSDRVEKLSVKRKPIDGNHWYTVSGNFTFSNCKLAQTLISKTISNHKAKQELHLEEVINTALSLGLKVKALFIPIYMSVGVPDEIDLINYIKNETYSQV